MRLGARISICGAPTLYPLPCPLPALGAWVEALPSEKENRPQSDEKQPVPSKKKRTETHKKLKQKQETEGAHTLTR